jgi:hypothetical protein
VIDGVALGIEVRIDLPVTRHMYISFLLIELKETGSPLHRSDEPESALFGFLQTCAHTAP